MGNKFMATLNDLLVICCLCRFNAIIASPKLLNRCRVPFFGQSSPLCLSICLAQTFQYLSLNLTRTLLPLFQNRYQSALDPVIRVPDNERKVPPKKSHGEPNVSAQQKEGNKTNFSAPDSNKPSCSSLSRGGEAG